MWQELQPDDPRQIGPYRLRGQLGVGGMGRVFLGLSADGRPVAVKVVRLDLAADPEFRTRFRREVAVARRVSGKFTAPVIDADLDSPTPWLATAYVAGPSLADAVAQHGPLPAAKVLELATGLAQGLSAIHAAGVVHRDLKPSNVLLAQDGPRLIDFGISRAVEASALTHTGMVVGSPGFMSPEQAEGREVGTASDIFSLGAVLAFAATGAGPFGAGSTPALVYRVVYSPPSLDRVPTAVRPLIERCLDKDPARRPAARDLLAQTGAAAPGAGWLPDAVTQTFLQQADHPRTEPVAKLALAGGQASAGRQRRQRRRLGRPAAVAALVAGLLAASAAGGLALTNYAYQPPSVHVGQSGSAAQVQPANSPVTATHASTYPSTAAYPAAAPGTSSPGTTPASTAPAAAPTASTPAPGDTVAPSGPASAPSADPWASGSPAPTGSPTAATGSY
jgi:eukaryotic-like serine/threonine-protein kinase